MPNWGDSGYDLESADRYLYGFYSRDSRLLKLGLVLREDRLQGRLSEVRRKSRLPDLEMVWSRCLPSISHEEAEHMEAACRLWLARSEQFRFVAKVDWLAVADELDYPAWWLDRAVDAVEALGPADVEASNRAV